MVKNIDDIAYWMAGKTGIAFVNISANTGVLLIRFRVLVAGGTGELAIVARHIVTVEALVPFAIMSAAVNGEILFVVVVSRWFPGGFRVTFQAVG